MSLRKNGKKKIKKSNKKISKRMIITLVVLLLVIIGGAITGVVLYINEQNRTETVEVVETESIPFKKKTVKDSNLAKGTTKVKQKGVNGVKTKTYKVTRWVHKDQSEIGRVLIKEEVTKKPKSKITAKGTYVAPTYYQPQQTTTTKKNSSSSSSNSSSQSSARAATERYCRSYANNKASASGMLYSSMPETYYRQCMASMGYY